MNILSVRLLALIVLVTLTGCAKETGESGAGPVKLTVDATGYRQGDVVVVTIKNESAVLYTEDMKTDCSIVMLERSDGTKLDNCGMERAAQIVSIEGGEQREVRVNLASSHFAFDPAGPGTYRVLFGFRRSPQPEGVVTETVTTPTFAIR